jgi:hypothetical protein
VSLGGIAGRRTPSCLSLLGGLDRLGDNVFDDRDRLGDNVFDDRDRLGDDMLGDPHLSENNVPDEPDYSDGDTPNCHGLSGSYTTSGRRK